MQNITPTGSTAYQELAVTLALCEKLLDDFKRNIECFLGADSCHVLSILREGGIREDKI